MIETFNWKQKFTFIGSNLSYFFKELDFRIFHLITLSRDKEEFPHICNVSELNIFFMWRTIYPEIKNKRINQIVDSEDIYIIFLIIQYVSDYYISYGDKRDNAFLSKSDELFKWYHSIFPHQSFENKIKTVFGLMYNHSKRMEQADNNDGK